MNSTSKSLIPWILRILLLMGFAVMIARIGQLQVVMGGYYRDLAENNRIRRVIVPAQRGEIHARGGETLVGNFEDSNGKSTRDYKLGAKFGHVSGYLGEVSQDEVGKVDPDCPAKGVRNFGTLVGRTGLEEKYDCELSGVNGEELYEVDSRGVTVRRLGLKEPTKGENIVTNIDLGLQLKAAGAMGDKKGAIVISDTKGEILALYSAPSFDPNMFLQKDNSQKLSHLLQDGNKPFFNRAIGGLFHPGSVFKPVVALAALEKGVIDKNYRYEDTGKIVVKTPQGDFSYSNWFLTQYGGVEGLIGLNRALARSTDTFFYKVGELLGPDNIASFANSLHMGSVSGIDLPGEVAGLVPTTAWKREVKGESWFLGNTYHYAIGQGDLAVTPLSINLATSAVLTGSICEPKIVGEAKCSDLSVNKENLELVKKGMVEACSSGGTANVFFGYNPQVACKTGTAQTGVNDKSHAWFTVMAPAESESKVESTQIIVTVLVEEGGEGSSVAAPIAKEILDFWFEK